MKCQYPPMLLTSINYMINDTNWRFNGYHDITIKCGLPTFQQHPTTPSLSASAAEKPPHSDDSNVDPLQDQSWETRRKPYPLVGKKTWQTKGITWNYCKWASEEFLGNHLKWRLPPLNQILICDTNHIKSACIVCMFVGSPSPATQPYITSPIAY